MSISRRGAGLAKIGFDHGELNAYHPDHNPNGAVKLLYAENRLMHKRLSDFINQNVRDLFIPTYAGTQQD
ncbi:uncharacterized protein AB675_2875 [Cyphellophora attinorum]|uniref:Uncharacterized protein n=1 Tax=Cyphellophora attinorum TaxID=1664694 RepID=A0A0N1P2C7_9EURO|nr:uncharacterized protein AB675_2875 [Phialophora attinorum]KPI45057.1 hypothetical protein AB675_2875 [Phialophora attinorum]